MVYLKRAGYDPTAMVRVLERLQQAPTAQPDIFDDTYMKKDDFTERLLKANSNVRDEGYRSNTKKQFQERYERNTTGVR
jgi:predicted Zn-dependent protease